MEDQISYQDELYRYKNGNFLFSFLTLCSLTFLKSLLLVCSTFFSFSQFAIKITLFIYFPFCVLFGFRNSALVDNAIYLKQQCWLGLENALEELLLLALHCKSSRKFFLTFLISWFWLWNRCSILNSISSYLLVWCKSLEPFFLSFFYLPEQFPWWRGW